MVKSDSKTPFQPLGRDGLVQQIVSLLSDAIIAGKLKPGERLYESAIARDLTVSRAPVREAARLLESSGLVSYEANRGFFVRKISISALEELYELRIAIETASAVRLIRMGSADQLNGVRAQYEALIDISATQADMRALVEADLAFHRTLIEASGNSRFLTIFDQIATETELSIMVIGRLYGDARFIAETHLPLVEAISARNEAEICAALTHHLGDARRRVTDQFRLLESD